MNLQLQEINQIICLCEDLIKEIKEKGVLHARNQIYEDYKTNINRFMTSNDLKKRDFGPYVILDSLYFSTDRYTVNLSEAQTIYNTVVELKHSLFSESYEKIFISHREKDKEQVAAFIELLYAIGIPRPTIGNERTIFCTSHPDSYIDNGLRNMDEIREQFNSSDHIFFILWYTDNYFHSQACLNEAGAIWATKKKYQEILAPGFDSSQIGGLMDKQKIWFKADDKFRLNSFLEQIDAMFNLAPLTQNAWENARDSYIEKLGLIVNKQN